MLKSLIGKIKSEKSASSSFSQEFSVTGKQSNIKQGFKQLLSPEESQVQSSIQRIRYFQLESPHDIYNQVLACPISVFNKLPYAKRKVKQIDLKNQNLPEYLTHLKPLLTKELPSFNHLLINVYPVGVGIMPHFDGPLYKPKVVVLSLGGPSIISFTDSYQNASKLARLLLQDQSIHIFEEEAYQKFLHGIQNYTIDSIFLKIIFNDGNKQVQFKNASVANFKQTYLSKLIVQKLKKCQNNEKIGQIDLSPQMGTGCCLMPIFQNESYNYKIQIQRKERISITIRQKLIIEK